MEGFANKVGWAGIEFSDFCFFIWLNKLLVVSSTIATGLLLGHFPLFISYVVLARV